MNVQKLLSEHFCKAFQIEDGIYDIESVDAMEFFVPERIDLIAKYKYVEYRDKGYNLTYAKKLYTEHIAALSLDRYTEPGQESTKNSIDAYLTVFDGLISDIKNDGFDSNKSVVPVGNRNTILNGSHRTAVAAYYGIPLPVIRFDIDSFAYGTDFFADRRLHPDYLDYMVYEYCKLKTNVYVAIIWPKGAETKENRTIIDESIRDNCKVVYKKKLNLSFNGLKNMVTQVYHDEEWLGTVDDHFAGAENKALECYDKNGNVVIYVIECPDVNDLTILKQKTRDKLGLDKSSLHTTDRRDQALHMCSVVLNSNSIDLLNCGQPSCFPKAHRLLDTFKERLQTNELRPDDFIVDSSGVLGLYGLRDIADVDFLTMSENFSVIEDAVISNHRDYLQYYGKQTDELLYNPENYLIYNGIKFTTLEVVREMKQRRGDAKDMNDVMLINSFRQKNRSKKSAIIYYIQRKAPMLIRRKKIIRDAITIFILKALKMLRLYSFVRYVYRRIRH